MKLRVCLFGVLAMLFCQLTLMADVPSRYHQFARVGDGTAGDIGIKTIILVMNQNSESVKISISFLSTDGSPLVLTVNGATGSTLGFDVPANGMLRLESSGDSDPIKAGWAQMTAGQEVGAQVLFEITQAGELVTSAAVSSQQGGRYARLFAEQAGTTRTGLGLANLSSVGSVLIRITVRDESGAEVKSEEITLGPLECTAQFLDEAPFSLGAIQGTLEVNASGPLGIITLQQTGLVLATLPVIEFF